MLFCGQRNPRITLAALSAIKRVSDCDETVRVNISVTDGTFFRHLIRHVPPDWCLRCQRLEGSSTASPKFQWRDGHLFQVKFEHCDTCEDLASLTFKTRFVQSILWTR